MLGSVLIFALNLYFIPSELGAIHNLHSALYQSYFRYSIPVFRNNTCEIEKNVVSLQMIIR